MLPFSVVVSTAALLQTTSYDTLFAAAPSSPLAGKRALITGASSGIGKATACALAQEGCNLVLVARRSDRLRELQQEVQRRLPDISVEVVVGDVTQDKLFNDLQQSGHLDNIDILVNNAGGAFGKDRVLDASVSDWQGMLSSNCLGAFRMVHAVLPAMVKRGAGHIISTGSIAGIEAYEGGSVYCAAKHALHAFMEALRYETYETGVRCTVVAPGNVGEGTEFSEVPDACAHPAPSHTHAHHPHPCPYLDRERSDTGTRCSPPTTIESTRRCASKATPTRWRRCMMATRSSPLSTSQQTLCGLVDSLRMSTFSCSM